MYVATILAWPEGIKVLLENGAVSTQLCTRNNILTDGSCNKNSLLHSLLQAQRKRWPENLVVECAVLLIEGGLKVNTCNFFGESLIYCAALADYPSLVEKLLDMEGDPTLVTHSKRTALHAACLSGSDKSLEVLLKLQSMRNLILQEDEYKESPFHLAVKTNSHMCCFLLTKYGDHLMNEDSNNVHRYELLDEMASYPEFYNKLFDSSIHVSPSNINDSDLKVTFNYKCLVKNDHKVQCSPMHHFMENTQSSVLEHPLVESFLSYKFHCIKPIYYAKILLYFIFLVIHSWYIVHTYGSFPMKWAESLTILYCFQSVYVFLFLSFLIPDSLFMLINFKRYFKQWETLCKLLALSTAAFVIFSPRVIDNKHIPQYVQKNSSNTEITFPIIFYPPRSTRKDIQTLNKANENDIIIFPDDLEKINPKDPPDISGRAGLPRTSVPNPKKTYIISGRFGESRIKEEEFKNNVSKISNSTWSTYVPIETYIAAVSGFLGWAELMFLMAKLPSLGVFILIFTDVALSLGKFLFTFSSLIIGFGIAFHILFKNISVFGTVEGSMVKTLVMIIGEIEYGDMIENPMPVFSKCFLIVFLFLMTVLLINLMIGLTIDDIPKLKEQGRHVSLIKKASFVASYENLLTISKKLKCFPVSCILKIFRSGKFEIGKSITVYENRKNKVKIQKHVLIKARKIYESRIESMNKSSSLLPSDFVERFNLFQEKYQQDKKALDLCLQKMLSFTNTKVK